MNWLTCRLLPWLLIVLDIGFSLAGKVIFLNILFWKFLKYWIFKNLVKKCLCIICIRIFDKSLKNETYTVDCTILRLKFYWLIFFLLIFIKIIYNRVALMWKYSNTLFFLKNKVLLRIFDFCREHLLNFIAIQAIIISGMISYITYS